MFLLQTWFDLTHAFFLLFSCSERQIGYKRVPKEDDVDRHRSNETLSLQYANPSSRPRGFGRENGIREVRINRRRDFDGGYGHAPHPDFRGRCLLQKREHHLFEFDHRQLDRRE
jgi:hypothetical protein